MIRNEKYQWAHASLDGELTDQDGRKGILEIKTTNILQSMQRENGEIRFRTTITYRCCIICWLLNMSLLD